MWSLRSLNDLKRSLHVLSLHWHRDSWSSVSISPTNIQIFFVVYLLSKHDITCFQIKFVSFKVFKEFFLELFVFPWFTFLTTGMIFTYYSRWNVTRRFVVRSEQKHKRKAEEWSKVSEMCTVNQISCYLSLLNSSMPHWKE